MARWLSVGCPFSCRRLVIGGILCSLLFLYNYSSIKHLSVQFEKLKHSQFLAVHPLYLHDLREVENLVLLPPYGLKYPEKINFNDEYLNASSPARSLFFPKPLTIGGRFYNFIDPRKTVDNETRLHFDEGKVWMDTDGNPIQAHGGGILFDEKSGSYYWYGENKDGPTYLSREKGTARVDFIGINCYSSKDLWEWKNEGIVLAAEERNETHDLHKTKVVERPKVIYNERSGKYVMWMHVDDATYSKASVGIAISDSPTGPFEYLYSQRPNGFESRDMTVYKDEDGIAYLIYSSARNKELHISPLNQDYCDVTNVTVRVLVGQYREAPALFKHQGIYYMITSGCSGWTPNEALVHEAESIFGPWETIGNPCMGANKVFRATTFFAQGTFVIPMPGARPGSFIFMADRWDPTDLRNSRYVWLPLTVTAKDTRYAGLPLWSRVSILWLERWKLPLEENDYFY